MAKCLYFFSNHPLPLYSAVEWPTNATHIVTYNLSVQMKLLNPVLKKLHTDSVAVPEWYFSNQDPL
jgi:hypothetical protein